jgi:drug/metabolite transporter (DMT)-like permease
VVLAIACALAAAACFAAANDVQTVAARRSRSSGVSPRLLWRLAHDRLWWCGLAASAAGFAFQACALFSGPVVVVQPLVAAELLFALPLAAQLPGQARLTFKGSGGALLVAAGVGLFVLQARHVHGRASASPAAIAALTGGVVLTALILTVVAQRLVRTPQIRGGLLAVAAATCFGALSINTRVTGHLLLSKHEAALLDVRPWLLVVTAVTGLVLMQASFQMAPLSLTLPLIDIGEPVVAAGLAAVVFGERIGSGSQPGRVGAVAAALVAVAGILLLDRTTAAQAPPCGATPNTGRHSSTPDSSISARRRLSQPLLGRLHRRSRAGWPRRVAQPMPLSSYPSE